MGFFSGITKAVGGLLGGGSSKSTQTSTQATTVDNKVEVNFDVDKLAAGIDGLSKTMEQNTLKEIFFGAELATAELSIKEKDLKAKEDAIKVSLAALNHQIKTDEQMQTYTIIGIVIAVITLVYNYIKNRRKGKK